MTSPTPAPAVAPALADAAFVIGQSHLDNAKPCQDYAGHGILADTPEGGPLVWAAVADGCSTGGHTDIGARMWVHAVRRALEHAGPLALQSGGILKAVLLAEAATLLGPFEPDDALATLGVLAAHGETVHAKLFGDGVIGWRTADGERHVQSVRYARNAPRYLAYELPHRLCGPRLERWKQLVDDSVVTVSHERYDARGTLLERTDSVRPAVEHELLELAWSGPERPVALLVSTDGAESVEGRSGAELLEELMAVRNPTGAFMHRRLGAMARGWKKDARGMPMDDLGVAALWLATPAL